MAELDCLGFLLGASIDWSCKLSYAIAFDLVGCAVSSPYAMLPTHRPFTMLVTAAPVRPGTTEVIAEASQSTFRL